MCFCLASLLVLGAAAASCSKPADPLEGGNPDAVFPHPETFDVAGTHGAQYLTREAGVCTGCHVLDSVETAPIPGCKSCHAGYPHVEGWQRGEQHGATALAGVEFAACTNCHGAALDGGVSGVACNSCHTAWPHPEGWDEGPTHAAFIAARGTMDACWGCHVAAGALTQTIPDCASCHELYPHQPAWREPANHGIAWQTIECGTCHGSAGEGGVLSPSCRSCHSAYPHEAGWNETGHMMAVNQQGDGACRGCHGPGDAPPTMTATCGRLCHGVAP